METQTRLDAASGRRKVAKDTFFYMIAALLPQAAGFVTLPLFSRYLTPDDYGLLGILAAFSSFLPLLWTLQIGAALSRFYFEFKGEELRRFLTTITASVAAVSFAGALLTYALLPSILGRFLPDIRQEDYPLFVLTLATAYLGILGTHFMVMLRTRREARRFMILALITFAAGLGLNVLEVVLLRRGAAGMVEAGLYSAALNLLLFGAANLSQLAPALDFRMLRGTFAYSLPLVPHTLSTLTFLYSDRLIMARYLPLAIIGLYTFSDRIAGLFKIMVNELNNAFQPHFFKTASEDRELAARETRAMAKAAVIITSLGVSVLALFSAEAVDWLLDERYFPTWRMIPLLASSWVFRALYCFSTSGLFFEKKTGKIALITALSAILNIAINVYFLPLYGVWTAIGSTILSYWGTYFMSEWVSRKSFHLPLDGKINAIFIGFMYTSIAASFYLNSAYMPGTPLPLPIYLAKGLLVAAGAGLLLASDANALRKLANLRGK